MKSLLAGQKYEYVVPLKPQNAYNVLYSKNIKNLCRYRISAF